MDLDDAFGCRHLQDQVPVMGNGHEPAQGGPTEDGVEGEVDLCDVEDDALRAVVLMHPESYREGDATTWNDGVGSHSQKWVRGSELGHRNLQLLESYQTDKVEGYLTINQDVIQFDVGDGGGED
jgi:hypothetical protein